MKTRVVLMFFVLSVCVYANAWAQCEIPGGGSGAKYQIRPEESRFTVITGTSGLFGFLGHDHRIAVKNFSGEAAVDPQGAASLKITVKAASMEETGDFNKKDRNTINTHLQEDVLESARFPEIRFTSTSVKMSKVTDGCDVKIYGDLNLHGITRPVEIPARLTVKDGVMRAVGEFQIKRSDYNVRTESAGGGTVKVSKTLKISFDIVGRSVSHP